jgi:hypothetical protein
MNRQQPSSISSHVVYELVPETDSEADAEETNIEDNVKPTTYACLERCYSCLSQDITWLHHVFDSAVFQMGVGCIIMTNAIVIGLETDCPHMFNWDILENIFLLIFTMELSLKVALYTPQKFFDPFEEDFEWNAIDFVVVSIGIFNLFTETKQKVVQQPTTSKEHHPNSFATLLRIMRLLRLVRIFRLFRFLKKLYLLTMGLSEAIRSTFWVTILMTIILYTCAVALTRTAGKTSDGSVGHEFLASKFGSVGVSMMSLFQITASPDLTEYQEEGVLAEYPFLLMFIIIWVVFGAFGMVAMLTGVISESMFEKNQARIEEQRKEHHDKRETVQAWCKEKFVDIPVANDIGEVDKQYITPLMSQFKALCEEIGLPFDCDDLEELPEYMDDNESGFISLQEFTHHVLSTTETGLASIHEVKHILDITRVQVNRTFASVSQALERLESLEGRLEGHIKSSTTQVVSSSQAPVEPADLLEKSIVETPPIEVLTSQSQSKDMHVSGSGSSAIDFQGAIRDQCSLDAIWASCESFMPKLQAVMSSAEDAAANFSQLQMRWQLLFSSESKVDGNATKVHPAQDSTQQTSGLPAELRHQESQFGAPRGACSSDLEQSLKTVVAKTLAAVTSSIGSERAHIVDLTNELRSLVARLPAANELSVQPKPSMKIDE